MSRTIEREVARMRQMAVSDLRTRFVELFGEPARSPHKEHLVRRIAWRLQCALPRAGTSN